MKVKHQLRGGGDDNPNEPPKVGASVNADDQPPEKPSEQVTKGT